MPAANRRRAPAQKPTSILSAISSNSWLIGIFCTVIFSVGSNYAQFGDVKKTQEESKAEQKQVRAEMSKFREDQIRSSEDVRTIKNNMQGLETNVRNLDGRVLVIERTFIEPNKKGK